MITILIRQKREVWEGGEGEKRKKKMREWGGNKKNREKLVFTLIKALLNKRGL